MKKDSEGATIVAFHVAPLVASITAGVLTFGRGDAPLSTYLMVLPIAYLYSCLAVVAFGLPLYFVFKRLNFIKWWSCIAAGAVIGVLYGIVFLYPSPLVLHELEMYALIGANSTFSFWLIWSLGR